MRKNLYTILVATTLLLFGAIFVFAKKPKKDVATFKERTGSIALAGEWMDTKKSNSGFISYY